MGRNRMKGADGVSLDTGEDGAGRSLLPHAQVA